MRGRGSFLACESVKGTVFVLPEEVREQVEEEGGQEEREVVEVVAVVVAEEKGCVKWEEAAGKRRGGAEGEREREGCSAGSPDNVRLGGSADDFESSSPPLESPMMEMYGLYVCAMIRCDSDISYFGKGVGEVHTQVLIRGVISLVHRPAPPSLQ